jgi:mannose-6-phosphate isomerase-like protein (cupin superfamily)
VEIRSRDAAVPFTTTDGSTIRSLLDRAVAPVGHQSLAEAELAPGQATVRHYHRASEEIYYLVEGSGLMEVDGETSEVGVGDAVLIPPGARHRLRNTGAGRLRLLCCCAPPWAAEDTLFD